jgi:predicted nucleotidyltransferase
MGTEAVKASEMMMEALLRELGAEVDLVFRYGSVTKGTANAYSDLDISYVPANESTWNAITVTVDDVLIDLYPIHWSRLEEMADFEDVSCTVLLANQLLYQRSDAVAERFRALPARLNAWLQPEARPRMLQKAQLIFQRTGYDYYLLREQATAGHQLSCLYQARKLMHAVFHCLAVYNQACVDTRKLEQVLALAGLPNGFSEAVRRVTMATGPEDALAACDALMNATRKMLFAEQNRVEGGSRTFRDVFGTVYPELRAMIGHVKKACAREDRLDSALFVLYYEVMVHISRAMTGVQYTSFNCISDFERNLSELGFPDLLALFAAGDFKALERECDVFDDHLRMYLEQHAVALNMFADATQLQEHLRRGRAAV